MDMVAGVLFLFVIVQIEAPEQRSVAECDNQSGQVYYDPKEKKCVCNRRSCHSTRNPPDLKVKEDVCVRLRIKCDKGEQPNPKETECVVCPEGTFKEDKGCDWCTPMTTCKDTEWVVFNGNKTNDRTCSSTKPDVPRHTNVTYPTQPSSRQQNFTTTTTSLTTETITEVVKATGSSLSTGHFYIFCITCGVILFAVVVLAGLKKWLVCMFFATFKEKVVQSTDDVERGEEKEKPMEKKQTYIRHPDEDKNTYEQIPNEEPKTAGGVRTVGQSLVLEENVTPKEVYTDDTHCDKEKNLVTTSSYSTLDFSSLLNDRCSTIKPGK